MLRDLVLRARDGDHDAFVALAADAYDRLYRTARLILRREDAAADAVQDAFTNAWLHIRAVRDPDRFEAWLYRLTIRACYTEAGRARRRSTVEIHVVDVESMGDADVARGVADRDLLERAFRRLTPAQRAVIVLHHYLDLSNGEAALALGIPVETYRSRLRRAMNLLRASIEADERAAPVIRESLA